LKNTDESEMLDVLKRIMSQLILNTKQNIRYESVSLFYPEIIKSIHN
jgi:hypothetical protein